MFCWSNLNFLLVYSFMKSCFERAASFSILFRFICAFTVSLRAYKHFLEASFFLSLIFLR